MSLFGFGKGGGEMAAREMLVPFLGNMPLDPEMVDCGDSGKPMGASAEHSAVKVPLKASLTIGYSC
jgi:ATP-binding protein involved in chromosome partitioning